MSIARVLISERGRQTREDQRGGSVRRTEPDVGDFEAGGKGP